MSYPTGILKNTTTGRFHPVSFRAAPLPGDGDGILTPCRYKSFGHHTFASLDAATHWIKSDERCRWVDRTWEWDGDEGIPALVFYGTLPKDEGDGS